MTRSEPYQYNPEHWRVISLNEVSSTMVAGRELARALSAESLLDSLDFNLNGLVMAKSQTSGRGRQGRSWHEGSRGFYGTYIFRTKHELSLYQGFSLAVGVGIAKALDVLGANIYLKWPNDLLTGELIKQDLDKQEFKKLGGILIETITVNENELWFLVGVGINLGVVPKDVPLASSLYTMLNRDVEAIEIAQVLTPELAQIFETFSYTGLMPYIQEWKRRCPHIGNLLQVDTGDAKITGEFIDLHPQGAMMLRKQNGDLEEITAGHIINGAYATSY